MKSAHTNGASSAAQDTNGQICQTAEQGDKKCTGLRSLAHFDTFCKSPKSSTWNRFDPTWPQHWPDLGPTWASKAPTSALSKFGPSWGPYHMASKWGTCTKSSRCPFSLAFSMFFPLSMMLRLKQCSPCCVSVGPVELSPKVPSCGMLELTWTSNSLGRGRFILVLLYSFVAAAFILVCIFLELAWLISIHFGHEESSWKIELELWCGTLPGIWNASCLETSKSCAVARHPFDKCLL